ncbi:hypothetical protein LTSEUGA_4169 [Salmonella enterica subsp. enterica serovar Uganda str. R8-3404]|uniref:Uncharacterized protein n=1 Tax=Salmonella enterica subsp. enterica serovar Uganda str. R8-3404 TaxID=913083 RepID=A0A6C8GYE7_SALET|nr:hypothetical protein LTSEUGA_4169 [Salmonella enterica subsp. enterica serovar Uganda str. R8-3404]
MRAIPAAGWTLIPGAAIPISCPPRAGWRDSNFFVNFACRIAHVRL